MPNSFVSLAADEIPALSPLNVLAGTAATLEQVEQCTDSSSTPFSSADPICIAP